MSATKKALSTSVLAIDASRRVGWAKAYEAEERLDELSHDYNVARGDRENFKSGLSFLWGFTMTWFKAESQPLYVGLMRQVLKYEATLDPKLVRAGSGWARSVRQAVPGMATEESRQNTRENHKYMDELRHRGAVGKAAKYGFRTVREMDDLLERYQSAKGWKSRTFEEVLRASGREYYVKRWLDEQEASDPVDPKERRAV